MLLSRSLILSKNKWHCVYSQPTGQFFCLYFLNLLCLRAVYFSHPFLDRSLEIINDESISYLRGRDGIKYYKCSLSWNVKKPDQAWSVMSKEGQGILKSGASLFMSWKFLGKETVVFEVNTDTFSLGITSVGATHICSSGCIV